MRRLPRPDFEKKRTLLELTVDTRSEGDTIPHLCFADGAVILEVAVGFVAFALISN